MAVNTTGILTTANCAIPSQVSVNSSVATNWTVSATSADGCTVDAGFNPSASNQQFGVENVPNCGSNSTDPTFQPVCTPFPRSQPLLIHTIQVLFWFWQQEPNGFAAVFCEPTIQLYNVIAFASLDNGTINSVSKIDDYPEANNVSGNPLNTIPYNGYVSLSDTSHLVKSQSCLYSLIFNTSTDVNVQARAISIRSGVPNAIYRLAQQSPGGLDFAFQNTEAFANYTDQVYVRGFTGVPRPTSPKPKHYHRLSISPLRPHQTTSCGAMRP